MGLPNPSNSQTNKHKQTYRNMLAVYLDAFHAFAFEKKRGVRGPWDLYYVHLLGPVSAWHAKQVANFRDTDVPWSQHLETSEDRRERLFRSCSIMMLWEPGGEKGEYVQSSVDAWTAMRTTWAGGKADVVRFRNE